ncbi:hypothetical protein LLEC1_07753 [Akanthomyces lecanii]|uniref:Response regulatory domain-containing protein n=1 Tax=Cordyceps confragosa TaxID=2714763 RepID=A0A179I7X6_CORDF|nr:hypothetical protein LLEC1_07753 [Akanthomyces lecanii]
MPPRRPLRFVSEAVRGRETIRYAAYLLDGAVKNDSGEPMSGPGLRTSPDAHLTALAQLGALRTSTSRSLISIFDKDYQYVVAEATTSISLAASLPKEHHGEDLWLCGTAIPRRKTCPASGLETGQGTQNTVDAGLMSLQSVVNLGSLAEEVVESVFAGFHFQFMSVRQLAATGASRFPDEDRNSRLDGIRALEDLSSSTTKSQETVASLGSVAVFLMIDPHCNWSFFTEAGAMRRIIMNLFANSLKYTRKGVITVSLTQSAPKTNRPKKADKVVLTVSDTGVAPVAPVGTPAGSDMPTLDSTSALRDICTGWLKLQIVEESGRHNFRPDLIILAAERLSTSPPFPQFLGNLPRNADHECSPYRIGPQKFSKILVLALRRWQDLQSLRPDSVPSESDGTSSSEQGPIASPTTPPTSESYFSLAKADTAEDQTPPPYQPETQPPPMPARQRPDMTRRASGPPCALKWNFSTATNGQEAVDAYRNAPESFKCVFMDISMPIMDGLEATRAIRTYEREKKLPPVVVVALTGLASAEAQHDAFTSGVDLFLTKPVKLAELASILKSRGLLGK